MVSLDGCARTRSLATSELREGSEPRNGAKECPEVHCDMTKLFLVIATGRGVGRGCELLFGPLKVRDGASKSNACGSIGNVLNLSHSVPFQGVRLP